MKTINMLGAGESPITNHTPGPWEASESGPSIRVFAEPDAKSVRCVCDVHQYHGTKLQAWANARLIAAAPTLLAALQELCADKYLADPINADRMANARAAINKATGNA